MAAAQIYNMLKEYSGDVTIKIDGLAASAASVIAMAGDKVVMSPVAMMMIHNPSTVAFGDRVDMQKAMAMLDEVKESIINNSDCKILLDQRKYLNKFDSIQNLLGLTDKERSQILSINMANHPGRKYKEVFFSLGGTQSAVYATEVSLEEYYTYTTEESEKMELFALADKLGGNLELAIKRLAESKRNPQSSTT